MNRVWGTDIIYIRLAQGFVYLVAVMDWFTPLVPGLRGLLVRGAWSSPGSASDNIAQIVLTAKQQIPLGNIQLVGEPVKTTIRGGFGVMKEAAPAYSSVYACSLVVNPASTSETTWQRSAMFG